MLHRSVESMECGGWNCTEAGSGLWCGTSRSGSGEQPRVTPGDGRWSLMACLRRRWWTLCENISYLIKLSWQILITFCTLSSHLSPLRSK